LSWVFISFKKSALPLAALFSIRAHVASQSFLTVVSIEGAFPMNPISCKPIQCLVNQWSFGDVTHYTMPRYLKCFCLHKNCLFDFQPTSWLSLPFASGNVTETTKDLHVIFIYQFVQSFGRIIEY
jgi:hypothetical protein